MAPLPLPTVRAEELLSIKGELSQIKAQVDSLLESLDRMDQRRERLAGEGMGHRPSGTPCLCQGVRGPSPHAQEGAGHPELPGQNPPALPLPRAGRAESKVPFGTGRPCKDEGSLHRPPRFLSLSLQGPRRVRRRG